LLKKISQLSERLRAVQGEEEERGRREVELTDLRVCLSRTEEMASRLEGNLAVLSEQANESAESLRTTQQSLTQVSYLFLSLSWSLVFVSIYCYQYIII